MFAIFQRLFAIVVSQYKVNSQNMSARVHLYSEVLNFWGKDEIENYTGLYWDFFFRCLRYL